MRRRPVHLAAAIAESLRFLAVAFLAFDAGALLSPSASGLLRYAGAPQLLFVAGFFFLWLDPARYGAYRPLLLIGKAASIACFIPLAASLALALAYFVAVVDIASVSILALVKPVAARGPGPAAASKPTPGQSPDEIERVEGI